MVRMPDPPPGHVIPLDSAQLEELGLYCAVWSQLHYLVATIVAKLEETSLGAVHDRTKGLTAGPLFKELRKAAEGNSNRAAQINLEQICDDIVEAIEHRNILMHGLWAPFSKDAVHKGVICLSYKTGSMIFAADLEKLTNEASSFSKRLFLIGEQL